MAYTPLPYGSPLTGTAGATVYYGSDVRPSKDGLVLVVGEPGYNGARGQVYTYDWNGSAYVQRGSAFSAGDAAASNDFGQGVCVGSGAVPGDNNLLIVGAPNGTVTGTAKGKFYTYSRSGATWVKATAATYGEQTNSTPVTGENFGVSCTLSEDGKILAIGATYYTGGTATQGGVRIYDRSGSSPTYVWTARGSMIVNTAPVTNERFSRGVWFNKDGTVLAVGIPDYDGVYVDQGAVAVFDWNSSASSWERRTNLLLALPYGSTTERIANDIALSDDGLSIVVNSTYYDDLYVNEGCTRIYDYGVNSATWVLRHLYTGQARATNQGNDGVGATGNLGVVFTGYGLRTIGANANQGSVDMTIVLEGARPGAYGYTSFPKLTTTGYLATPLTMTGAVTLPSITAAGIGSPPITITGGVVMPTLMISGGTAVVGSVATGACALHKLVTAGTGGTYAGAVALPTPVVTGAGVVGLLATGACVLPKLTVSSAGQATASLSGAITLPRLTAAGTALTGVVGTSALRLPRLRTSGTLHGGVGGSAAITLPKLVVTSTAALGHTLAGVTRLPKIKVTGLRL